MKFTVLGIPVPQGSMTKTRRGMRHSNKRTVPWREQVGWAALRAREGSMAGKNVPIRMQMSFYFPRPDSHSERQVFPEKVTPPDLDKIVRCCLDALKGVLYVDDRQVVEFHAFKTFGEPPRMECEVEDASVPPGRMMSQPISDERIPF